MKNLRRAIKMKTKVKMNIDENAIKEKIKTDLKKINVNSNWNDKIENFQIDFIGNMKNKESKTLLKENIFDSFNSLIDNRVVIPMNNFAKKHPYFSLIFSIIALLVSILK